MRRSMSSLWWRDSNQTASGNPGAVHMCVFAEIMDSVFKMDAIESAISDTIKRLFETMPDDTVKPLRIGNAA